MVNKVILIGNLGADPETRQAGETLVCMMRLATTGREKIKGEWVDATEWHHVVCFGRTAENVAKYCKKGKQVYVEGRIKTRKWQDKEGKDRWTTEVIADEVRFLGGAEGGGQRREQTSHEAAKVNGYQPGVDPGDDIPF